MYRPLSSTLNLVAHYASFTATLANLIIDYESESLGYTMYGLIRQELLNVATSILPWAVQLHSSYDTISIIGGFSESDLVVLNNSPKSIPFRLCWARCRTSSISG
jgi:hypothetical protein